MVFPALGGGEPISLEAIQKVLEARGITYGLIKDEIERLASAEGCFTLLPVARGVAPVPGVDGKVIDRFPRTIGSPHFIENAQGIVDFNNLNWLVPIEKDTVICEILPPVKGKEAKNFMKCAQYTLGRKKLEEQKRRPPGPPFQNGIHTINLFFRGVPKRPQNKGPHHCNGNHRTALRPVQPCPQQAGAQKAGQDGNNTGNYFHKISPSDDCLFCLF